MVQARQALELLSSRTQTADGGGQEDCLEPHYRKLRWPLQVRGLWRRRRIERSTSTLHLHGAGLAVHSGTIPTERQGAVFLPDACKTMGEDTFELIGRACVFTH